MIQMEVLLQSSSLVASSPLHFTNRRDRQLTVRDPLLYSPIGLDLKLVKRALKRPPNPLNLIT